MRDFKAPEKEMIKKSKERNPILNECIKKSKSTVLDKEKRIHYFN